MAHYAFLDENNVVTNVIVGRDETEIVDGISDWESHYSEVTGQVCKRTSYNTFAGEHKNNGTPYRVNYASIGGTYDVVLDAFIPIQPFVSWTLDEQTCQWQPPVSKPTDGKIYEWDEINITWKEIIFPTE